MHFSCHSVNRTYASCRMMRIEREEGSRGIMSSTNPRPSAPATDAIITALANLVNDAKTETREPSHSDIDFQIQRAGLTPGDPKTAGQVVGKAKRVRAVLSWALEHDHEKGERFVAAFIAMLKGKGGFRKDSPNFVGDDALTEAIEAFRQEGYTLSTDGHLGPASLDTLSGAKLTAALEAYVQRARRGAKTPPCSLVQERTCSKRRQHMFL